MQRHLPLSLMGSLNDPVSTWQVELSPLHTPHMSLVALELMT